VATILVADDNSNIQKMVGLALKDHGIDVVAVGNGEAAVRRIPDVHPDLILADIFMPVRNGYEVCEFVKKDPQYSHIPVILLVGAFDPLDEHEAQRVGADGVLKKPFIPPDPLINMVKSALARAAETRRPAPVSVPQPVMAAVAYTEAAVEQPLPSMPAAVSFGDADRPLAFGSMLETETTEIEPEAEAYVAPVPHPELSDSRNWGVTPEEEVEEEEAPETSWRAQSVPDELLADDTQVSEGSRYATTALPEPDVEAVSAVLSEPQEKLAHEVFARHDEPQQEPASVQAGSLTKAQESSQREEVPALEQGRETASEWVQQSDPAVEDKQVSEPTNENDYEAVFTADAFPGLFIEEKPPSPMELAEDSLQESPSAFAELSTDFGTAIASNVEPHSSETDPADAPLTDPVSAEPRPADSQSVITPPPTKLPALWEEQVRQAARLIASAWPGGHEAEESSAHEPASSHSEASASFSREPRSPEAETADENAPAYNAAMSQQVQQLFPAGAESARSIMEEIADVAEAPQASSFTAESSHPATALAESVVETPNSDNGLTEEPEPIGAVRTFVAAPDQHEEAVTSPSAATPASAKTQDLEAIVAKVLARMNPETFQSMTQQLLKPVIEAIVRSELEKK